MGLFDCTLSMLVARTDVSYMMRTIPHLVKACNFDFSERVLYIDASPLGKAYRDRPGIGTLEELRDKVSQLIKDNVIDLAVDVNFSEDYKKKAYKKYFGKSIKYTHNFRGAPILGYIFAIEEAKTNYLLHFDCDMLLYQEPNYSWIKQGIQLMHNNQDVVCALPLPGPPNEDGILYQKHPYEYDPQGFYKLKSFTTRKFLINRSTFEKLLPLKPLYLPLKGRTIRALKNQSSLKFFESMISNRLRETSYIRADFASSQAWTVHPLKHDDKFVQALPYLIDKIGSGWYPPEQGGHYDLILEAWL